MAETTSTQISDLPEYQKQYLQEILQRAQALGKQSYTLPEYQVAGRTPIQQSATDLATQGIGSYMPMLQAGEKATSAGIAATESLLDPNAAMAYMNPYQQAVIDQSMADIDRAGQMQKTQAAARAVGAGAFGGSREGIERAEIGRNILDQQARTASGLRQQGFAQAQQQQLQRAQAAAQGLGSLGMQQAKLGEAFQGMNINDINMLSAIGGQEQQQRQKELDAARQTQYQNVMQPYQQLGFYSDIFQGMPTSQSVFTSQQTPDPSMLSQLADLVWGYIVSAKPFLRRVDMNVMNRKMFANRNARRRLANMGGIMTSSPELMQAAQTYQVGGNVGSPTSSLLKTVELNGVRYKVYTDGRVTPDFGPGIPTQPMDPNNASQANLIEELKVLPDISVSQEMGSTTQGHGLTVNHGSGGRSNR